MPRNHLAVKTLIMVVVSSYFAYALYWFVKSFLWIIEISLRPEYYSPAAGLRFTNSYSLSVAYLMEFSGFFGLMIRIIGASYALLSAFLIFKAETIFSSSIKNKISKALFFEGFYFFSFIPAIYYLWDLSTLPLTSRLLLSTAFSTQIVLISPCLILLSLKLRKYSSNAGEKALVRLVILSCLSYVVAFWVTYVLKWAEMGVLEGGLNWLLTPPRIIAFLNSVFTLSLSVAFAIIGTLQILRKSGGGNTARWWGLASIFLSTHLIIYVLYVANVGPLSFIQWGELWVIPLIAVGAYLLLRNPKIKLG